MDADSSSSSRGRVGNTKQPSPQSRWCFTHNNYTAEDITTYSSRFKELCVGYAFQEEKGETTGTPHLQGVFWLKRKLRFTALKKIFDKAHLEPCRNWEASWEYSLKEATKCGNQYFMEKKNEDETQRWVQEIPELFSWQKMVLDYVSKEPDSRTILWVHDSPGNRGKTTFVKYLMTHHDDICLLGAGQGKDILFAVANFYKMFKRTPRVCLVHYPRDVNKINYSTLEDLKDMCFFSCKYESNAIVGPCPHVVVFSNQMPDLSHWSDGRCVLIDLDEV